MYKVNVNLFNIQFRRKIKTDQENYRIIVCIREIILKQNVHITNVINL